MADIRTTLTRLLTALSVSDPTWDISVGSATYKIMESVSQELSNVTNNSTLLSFGYSIATKAGVELDAFVNIFGINRQQGTRATGTVTFSTNAAASQDYQIPLGTSIYSPTSSTGVNIGFTTTSPAVLSTGLTSVQVPVICIIPGSQGNITAGSVVQLGTPLQGITAVVNESNMSNGTDTETDSQLRQRFLNTAFSNFAGTDAKFQSVAQQLPTTTRVNVIGSQENYTESLQIYTTVSAANTTRFTVGLNTQAQLFVASGGTTASGMTGQLPVYSGMTVASSVPAGTFTGLVSFDGTNYTLSSGVTSSGTLFVNFTVSGSTVVSGGSAAATVASAVTNVLSTVGLSNINITTTGVAPSGSLGITFSQGTPWNLIVASGTATTTNGITSQIPDSKYCYPAGSEALGVGLNTLSQQLLNRNTDYTYTQATGTAPLVLRVGLTPASSNAPYTFTGQTLQLRSQYIPMSSRVVTSGTSIVNPAYVDIFVDDSVTATATEQIIMNLNNTITPSGAGGTYSADKFLMGNGVIPSSGDYYLSLTQGPVANFPNQVLSGSDPNYITFGNYNFPISLTLQSGVAVTSLVGTSGSLSLTTLSSISGLQVGLVASGTNLGVGNYITNLSVGNPNTIILANNLPTTFSGSVTWVTVAYPVYDNTTNAGSIQDLTGVALRQNDPTGGAYSTSYPKNTAYQAGTLAHSYYSNVSAIDNVEQQSRIVGSNLLVHEVDWVNLVVNLSVVYNNNNTISSVNSNIQSAIGVYLANVSIGGTVSFGGLLQSVYSVNGVSSVRVTNSGESNAYGLQMVNLDASNHGTPYTKDILLNSNQAPRLFSVNFKSYGFNNF